jgi:hypothetical protein
LLRVNQPTDAKVPDLLFRQRSFGAPANAKVDGVLVIRRDFGLKLDPAIKVRVWGSNSEIRYMVLPQRPSGTDGMTEEELVPLVHRDAMIGVAVLDPVGSTNKK